MSTAPYHSPRPSLAIAYLQLFRLPNVFTAVADVLMGYLVVHEWFIHGNTLGMLVAASCLMYLAGMALNDVYDLEQDARERPHRPIPSGRIHPGFARLLGMLMLLLGAALGSLPSLATNDPRPATISLSLAVLVYLYDRVLKRTPLGPLAMGGCRTLNVLLGMSTAVEPWQAVHYAIAGGIGLYIVGVTWFVRTEARLSSRAILTAAIVVMLAGMAVLASIVYWNDFRHRGPDYVWLTAWCLLGASVAAWCVAAVVDPQPRRVQRAVKHCIVSLIVLDAVVALPASGQFGAVVIMILLFPMVNLGRWIYST